jgi:hypothetical protein
MNEQAGVSSEAISALPTANKQRFNIDDENWIDLGDATFHIGDIKSLMKAMNPQMPGIHAIVFGVSGSQLTLQLPDPVVRDTIYEEIKRRMIAIKNNKIHIYMAQLKREKEKQEKAAEKIIDDALEVVA